MSNDFSGLSMPRQISTASGRKEHDIDPERRLVGHVDGERQSEHQESGDQGDEHGGTIPESAKPKSRPQDSQRGATVRNP